MRRQQYQKQAARKGSIASQDRGGNSFRSSKTGGGQQNDKDPKMLTSFGKSGFMNNQLLVGKQKSQITPVKILTKVPASVLEHRGSRPSPQGRQSDEQLDFKKSSTDGGKAAFSAFSNKAKGFSLVREDMQKQISTYQNLMKKAQGGQGTSPDEASAGAAVSNRAAHLRNDQAAYRDQRYGPGSNIIPEKQRHDRSERYDKDRSEHDYDDSVLASR